MSADEEISIFQENDPLRELRLKYKRLRTLLAITEYEQEKLKERAEGT